MDIWGHIGWALTILGDLIQQVAPEREYVSNRPRASPGSRFSAKTGYLSQGFLPNDPVSLYARLSSEKGH
jgi:hypothetical protein